MKVLSNFWPKNIRKIIITFAKIENQYKSLNENWMSSESMMQYSKTIFFWFCHLPKKKKLVEHQLRGKLGFFGKYHHDPEARRLGGPTCSSGDKHSGQDGADWLEGRPVAACVSNLSQPPPSAIHTYLVAVVKNCTGRQVYSMMAKTLYQ